jgi:hypothetical protein
MECIYSVICRICADVFQGSIRTTNILINKSDLGVDGNFFGYNVCTLEEKKYKADIWTSVMKHTVVIFQPVTKVMVALATTLSHP